MAPAPVQLPSHIDQASQLRQQNASLQDAEFLRMKQQEFAARRNVSHPLIGKCVAIMHACVYVWMDI